MGMQPLSSIMIGTTVYLYHVQALSRENYWTILCVITYISQGNIVLRNNSQMHISKLVLKNYPASFPEILIQ